MKRFLSFFLVFALSVAFAVAGEKVTYRYAPELGKTITYRTVTTLDVPTPTGKMQQMFTRMNTMMTPLKREGNVYIIEGGISDFSIEFADMPMLPQVQKQLDEANSVLHNLKITTRVDERGRTVGKPKVEGLPAEIMGHISSQIEQTGVTNDLKAFPNYPIAEGDTWGDVLKDDSKDLKVDYRLVKITPTTLVVHSKGHLKMTVAGGVEQDYDFEGETQFSRTTGLVVPGTMSLKLDGSVKANGDSFPMKMQLSM